LDYQLFQFNIETHNLNYIIMSFNGNEGEKISLEQGGEFTARHRAAGTDSIKGVFFGKNHIEKILSQTDCKGLRLYFAKNADGNSTLVMVGADSAENDLLNEIFEMAVPCPNKCSTANLLNGNSGSK
jgi:hypothetical protein